MKYYLLALKKYAVFEGRASRREYWMFYLFNAIFIILAAIMDTLLGTLIKNAFAITGGLFSTIYLFAILLPYISIGVRRFHDVGKNGVIVVIVNILSFPFEILRSLQSRSEVEDIILLILSIFIIISGIYILALSLSPGDIEDNKYGISPSKTQPVNDVSKPEDSKIDETRKTVPEVKNVNNGEQFGKRENFIENKRRKGIFLFVTLLVVLLVALAGTLIYNKLSLKSLLVTMSLHMTMSGDANHTISGDINIKNKSSTEFVNVKIELGSETTVYVGTLLPYQHKSYDVRNKILSGSYDTFTTGWNLIALIILVFLLIVFLVSSVVLIFWLRNPRKQSLQLTDVSISSDNSTKEIKGILVNNSGREFSNVKIRFAVYNDTNIQIGMADVIVENIQPHRSALFQKTISKKLTELGAYYVELIKITKA